MMPAVLRPTDRVYKEVSPTSPRCSPSTSRGRGRAAWGCPSTDPPRSPSTVRTTETVPVLWSTFPQSPETTTYPSSLLTRKFPVSKKIRKDSQ